MKKSLRVTLATASGLAGLSLLFSGCNSATPDGAPPSEMKTAIAHPQNKKIFFTDGEHRQVITLHDDGSYLRKTGDLSGLVISKEDGEWGWKRSGSHEALLRLGEEEWKLTFVGPDDAMAVKPGSGAKMFHFEPM